MICTKYADVKITCYEIVPSLDTCIQIHRAHFYIQTTTDNFNLTFTI